MKLKLAVQEYLRDIEIKKYTPKTIRSYTVNLNVLLSFLETQNVYETEELTPLLMKEFALFMSKKGRKGTYINSLLKTSKSFITYCYNEGYGGFNTRYKFSWVKQEKPVIRAFKPNALLDRGFQIMHIRKNYASDNMVFQFKGDITDELNEILIHLGFKK